MGLVLCQYHSVLNWFSLPDHRPDLKQLKGFCCEMCRKVKLKYFDKRTYRHIQFYQFVEQRNKQVRFLMLIWALLYAEQIISCHIVANVSQFIDPLFFLPVFQVIELLWLYPLLSYLFYLLYFYSASSLWRAFCPYHCSHHSSNYFVKCSSGIINSSQCKGLP